MKSDESPGGQGKRTFTPLYRSLSIAFVILCLLSAFLLNNAFKTGIRIDTNLRALLPETEDNLLSQHAETRLLDRLGNTVILLVGATTANEAVEAANFGRTWLQSHSALRVDIEQPLSHGSEQLIQQMKDHRFHLLTPEQRQLLKNDDTKVLLDKAWGSILGLQSWARITSTKEDPLALFDAFVEWIGQTSSTGNVTKLGKNVLFSTPQRPGWFFAPLYIDTGKLTFQLNSQTTTIDTIAQLQTELGQHYSGVQTLKSGVIFHAAEAAQRAQSDVTLISLGSLLGIIALFIAAFRSLTPMVMSLASVLFGCLVAFSIVNYLYSGLHIITLVFGAALIGVSVDYSLHYFTKRFSIDASSQRFTSLRAILPAISLGLITSVIGYGSLSQAPLASLNQVALFSVTGLIGAWLFVIVIYPWVRIRAPKPIPAYLTRWALFPHRCWQVLERRHLYPTFILVGLGVLGTLSAGLTMTTTDDVRILYTPSANLLAQDTELKTIISSYSGNQFFIVTGATEQGALQNEEAFHAQLDELVKSGTISSYQSITRFLPSIARQQADYRLQKRKLYDKNPNGEPGLAPRFMKELGFDAATVTQLMQHFSTNENDYLTPENWPGLQKSGLDLLWLGKVNKQFATLILLQGIKDTASLKTAADSFDKVMFVDKVSELSNILSQQRRSATTMLALAYGAIIILLLLRYRRITVVLLALVPLVATLLTISLLSSAGMSIGLFHLFAMFLILGLGMDYSIFIYESSPTETASHMAILFSAVTSCLSFGLLALSSTPMVQFFGATILIGSILNLLLAPAVSRLSPGHPQNYPNTEGH